MEFCNNEGVVIVNSEVVGLAPGFFWFFSHNFSTGPQWLPVLITINTYCQCCLEGTIEFPSGVSGLANIVDDDYDDADVQEFELDDDETDAGTTVLQPGSLLVYLFVFYFYLLFIIIYVVFLNVQLQRRRRNRLEHF
jgi:hypothetical protein